MSCASAITDWRYLSGDTGVAADQERVVRDLYQVKLAVMNMGDGLK